MKRIGAILCLAALIVTMTASVCFGAHSLELVDNYPDNEQKNTTRDNMCVKLWFNNDMDSEKLQKLNKDCFSITGPKGKKIPIRVFYNNPKDKKQIMVLADTTKINTATDIKDNTKYTLTISGDLQDGQGNVLGEDQKISFTTLNQGQSTKVYMVMMLIMFGGMFFFSSRQMKKQMAKDKEESKEEPFNPYKEAKKTGKSVDEVMAIHEKEMAKKAAKDAKKASKQKETDEDDDYDEDDNGNYRVRIPKPVSTGGSSYITGRKAIAEAKKAEQERLEKRRAANAKKKKKK